MSREKPEYRDWMERLNERFPGRELIRKSEVAGWLGITVKTLRVRYTLPPGQLVSKVALARELCGT